MSRAPSRSVSREAKPSDSSARDTRAAPSSEAEVPTTFVRSFSVLLLAGLVLVAFGGAVRNGWIQYDDPAYVTKNPIVARGVTLDGLAHYLSASHSANWHPLTTFTHMLDVDLFGLDPAGPHAVNVALHLVSAILCVFVLFGYTRAWWPSLAVAALFALHPLRVESVAWIAERKDVLAGVFFWLTLDAYRRWTSFGGALRYALTCVLFALGLMSKPMLVTLPFVLLLLDAWPLARWQSRTDFAARVREKWPLFALSAAASVATFLAQRAGGAVASTEQMSFSLRVTNAVTATGQYLVSWFWPRDLAVFYPHARAVSGTAVIASVAAIAMISVSAWRAARGRHRAALVGWFWFLGMLVPVIGLVQVGAQARADRYTYLPTVGLAIALVFSVWAWIAENRTRRAIAGLALLGVSIALTWTARAQTELWRSTRTLFAHSLAVTERNALAEQVYGNALLGEGETEAAIVHLRTAFELSPDFPDVANNLGSALGSQGRYDQAIELFRRGLKTENTAETHHNLGFALAQLGRFDEAMSEYEAALAIDPAHVPSLVKLGIALGSKGRLAEAKSKLDEALQIDPNDVPANRGMATTCALTGDVERAVQCYSAVLRALPDDLDALVNSAWIRATHDDPAHRDGALAVQRSEHARDKSPVPDATVHSTLAASYAEVGRFDDAVKAAERAIELARGIGDADGAQRIGAQLEAYRARKPWHR